MLALIKYVHAYNANIILPRFRMPETRDRQAMVMENNLIYFYCVVTHNFLLVFSSLMWKYLLSIFKLFTVMKNTKRVYGKIFLILSSYEEDCIVVC
jgi:hypothetical protein